MLRAMQFLVRALPLLLLACNAGKVHAAQTSAGLEATWRDYDARETAPGGFVLNQESGKLPGFAVTLATRGNLSQLALRAAHEEDDIRYVGVTQLGVPVQTTTNLTNQNIALRWTAPRGLKLGRVEVRPHAEIARQRMRRAIRATALALPLTEILKATSLQAGLEVGLPLREDWELKIDMHLARPLQQELLVDTFGFYDKFSLRPHHATSGALAAGVEWQMAAKWRGGLWVSHERLRFGSSGARDVSRDGEVVGSSNYPGSHHEFTGLALRVEYALVKH